MPGSGYLDYGFATVGSYIDRQATVLQQVLSDSVEMLIPKIDSFWDDMIRTSMGVEKASKIGRDWRVIKAFSGGYAGVIEDGYGTNSYQNDAAIYGGATSAFGAKFFTQTAQRMFPNALEGPNQSTYWLAFAMRSKLTNLAFSLEEMRLEASPNVIRQVVKPKMKAFAKNMAHYMCNGWFTDPAKNYGLAEFQFATANWTAPTGGAAGYVTITLSSATQVSERFAPGMRVDIWDSTTTGATGGAPDISALTKRANRLKGANATRINCLVTAVDDLANKITISYDPSVTTFNSGGTDDVDGMTLGGLVNNQWYWISNANSMPIAGTPRGISNVNAWMKFGTGSNDNYLLGAERDSTGGAVIDVTVHPEFKSLLASSVGVLTEHKLRMYLSRFHSAKGRWGHTIDTVVASDGIWLNYESQKIGQYSIDRTSRLSDVNKEGSTSGFTFSFDGKTYKGHTSNSIENGVVYGIKRGNSNWKKYLPPKNEGSKSDDLECGVPFEFIVPSLTGGSSAKWPIQLTTSATSGTQIALTQMVQMPGMLTMQFAPDQPTGLKLTGVTEDRFYAST